MEETPPRRTTVFWSKKQEAPQNMALSYGEVGFNDYSTLCSEPTSQSSWNDKDTPDGSEDSGTIHDGRSDCHASLLEESVDLESSAREARNTVFMVSGRTQSHQFYGREDVLSQIDEVFFRENASIGDTRPSPLRSCVLCGMGGMGKTEIATQYVFTRKDRFDTVFWVSADTREKLVLGFREISKTLGLDEGVNLKRNVESQEVVKSWLSDPVVAESPGSFYVREEAASWLLVLDNVFEPYTLCDFWPSSSSKGCVLVTSRNPLSKETFYSPSLSIDLAPFTNDDAWTFLRSVSKREYEENSLETRTKIVELLGGLPLGIVRMGSIIRCQHLSMEEFVPYYHENTRKLYRTIFPGQGDCYLAIFSSIWKLGALSGAATALLQVLSLLDPGKIQESLLFRNTAHVDLSGYPESRSEYMDARAELLSGSLITKDPMRNELSIHRLVQDVVRERLSSSETAAVYRATIVLISNNWPSIQFDKRNEIGRLQQCEQLFPHVEKIRSIFECGIRTGAFQPDTACAKIFNEVACYMTERARDDVMGTYAELSFAILNRVSPDTFRVNEEVNRRLSQAHQYAAVSLIYTAWPGALDHLKIMTDLTVERLQWWSRECDRLQLADSYNEHAMALMRNPVQEQETVSYWIQSIDAFRAISGTTSIQYEWPSIHLALVYALRKDPREWQKGEDILLPVLKALEEKFGRDSTTSMVTGKMLHVLGDLRRSQGKLKEALELFQRALAIFRATIGDNHYTTGDTCYRFAEQLLLTNKKDEANYLLEQSLKIYGDTPWYKPQASRSSFMRGRLLRAMGNHVEGDAQLQKAMTLRKDVEPDDHRSWDQLHDEDFDKVVYYYSR